MLSIGSWQWNINITITITGFIHRPVCYLNPMSAPRRENRLMFSILLWRWYINTTITILNIIYIYIYRTIYNVQNCDDGIIIQLSQFWTLYIYRTIYNVQNCDDGILIQLSQFWTLYIYIQDDLWCSELWRWYINTTITILNIIDRPVFLFKTKLNSIGLSAVETILLR
jgi:hypothetical protein